MTNIKSKELLGVTDLLPPQNYLAIHQRGDSSFNCACCWPGLTERSYLPS